MPMTTGFYKDILPFLEQMEQEDDERCRRDGVPTRAERAKWKVVWITKIKEPEGLECRHCSEDNLHPFTGDVPDKEDLKFVGWKLA